MKNAITVVTKAPALMQFEIVAKRIRMQRP